MKKLLALSIALVLVVALAACKGETTTTQNTTTKPNVTTTTKSDSVMSYQEFAAAELESKVCVEAYVQAHQSWWDNNGKGVVSVYLQDENGGYFAYNLESTEANAALLTAGKKIKITGYKAEWAGEVEIIDATYEFVGDEDDTFVATATDVTNKLGTDQIANYKNQLVKVVDAKVTKAALYKWDGSGAEGDDLYYEIQVGEAKYTFVVESYLCDKNTDVYKAVKALKVGDEVTVEGFAYWYNGIQLHTTKVSKTATTYQEYLEAPLDTKVSIETYVQAHQSWWENNGKGVVSVYLQDENGGYFAYNLESTEANAALLTPGKKIKITGYKAEWAGETEIIDATYEFVEGTPYVATATNVTDKLGTDEIANYKNQLVRVVGATVTKKALYKWDGSGTQGDDLYYEVQVGEAKYTFVVESYLCDKDSDVYKAVEALEVGDEIAIEGFAYWYNGIQLHTTKINHAS